MTYRRIFIVLLMLVIYSICLAQQESQTTLLHEKVGVKGTVSFLMEIDTSYYNGYNKTQIEQRLVELPGLGACIFIRNYSFVAIHFSLIHRKEFTDAYIQVPTLPGPDKYHIIFTWDATAGLFDGYFNGINYRTEKNDYYEPWEMTGSTDTLRITDGAIKISDVNVMSKFITKDEAIQLVPQNLLGKNERILGDITFPSPINIESRKGDLVYFNKFNKEECIQDWILEGPAAITFESESMIMESTLRNPQNGSDGNFNIWCPVDLPESFIAEWEYQQLSDKGISLLFFSSRGKNGEDIFDGSLTKRDGHFQPYVNGDMDNYWIVFYSNNRTMRMTNIAKCYLAKSSKYSILSLGRLGIEPGNRKFHKIRLIKEGAHIQFQVDGKVCVDFTDPGNERWGPVLGRGRFSFRQMAVTIAAYKNFNVWELK